MEQKFSRYSSHVAMGAPLGAFAAGSGSTGSTATAASVAPIAFSNLRLFDGKSDALIEGLRVVVEGKTIKSVEPTETPLAPNARVVDCRGGVLMPGLIDAHWHAMMASLPVTVLLTADVGYITLVAADEARRTL
ncbi:MAG TPA: amidohydrolase family protein, partial [Roseiarcus sp.]|nr:amidohydrolase family protein [Roseiarcus sp.]